MSGSSAVLVAEAGAQPLQQAVDDDPNVSGLLSSRWWLPVCDIIPNFVASTTATVDLTPAHVARLDDLLPAAGDHHSHDQLQWLDC
jgi:hypothetical protein